MVKIQELKDKNNKLYDALGEELFDNQNACRGYSELQANPVNPVTAEGLLNNSYFDMGIQSINFILTSIGMDEVDPIDWANDFINRL